jgi:hypothetical protein
MVLLEGIKMYNYHGIQEYQQSQGLAQPRLRNTVIATEYCPNTVNGNLFASFSALQCCNQGIGQFIIEGCVERGEFTHAIEGIDLNAFNFVGTAIGNGIWCTGATVDVCASEAQNPTVRMAGMATADVCMTAGTVITYTPGVSTLLGAAAMGEPISAATVSTAVLAWLCAAPVSVGQAMCLYLCTHPRDNNPSSTVTMRLTQYRDINRVRAERAENSQNRAAVMQ